MKAGGVYKKLLGLFLATVTVLTVMGMFIHLSLQDREAYRWVTQSYEVQTRLQTTLLDVEVGQDAEQDYRVVGNPEALNTFRSSFQNVFADLNALDHLVADNPIQAAGLHSLRQSIIAYNSALEASARSAKSIVGAPTTAQEFALLDKVHRSTDRMKQTEQDLLEQRTRANRWTERRVNIALVCFLVVVSLLIVALFSAARQDLLQRQAAERLRHAADLKVVNILENISDAFFALNRDWVVTYMNEQAEHILEKPRAELVGKNLWSVYPDAVDKEFGRAYRRAIQEQVMVRFENYDEARASWYELRAYPNEDGLGIFVTNVNERKLTEEERNRLAYQVILHDAAQRRNQELQDLARRLVEMQEAERGHLAHELHEEVGQVLAGLKLTLASIVKHQGTVRVDQIQVAQDLVTELIRQVRALSLDLRPGVLDDLGLLPALRWYCTNYTEQSGLAVDLAVSGLDTRLDGTVETTVYRIVQEALANLALHPEVNAMEVRLTLEDELLVLQISDRSIGPLAENINSFCDLSSLTSMQERTSLIGGAFEVVVEPGLGTTILARIPIHPVYTSLET